MRPWDKLEGETDKAYGGFEAYCEASKFERTEREIARVCGVDASTINAWSKKYHWSERVRTWDSAIMQAQHDIIREHQSKRYLKRFEDRLKIEEKVSAKLESCVDELLDIATTAFAENHRISAIKEIIRLSHIDDIDLTKQVSEQQGADALALIISEDMQKLTDEEAATMRSLLEKMRADDEPA